MINDDRDCNGERHKSFFRGGKNDYHTRGRADVIDLAGRDKDSYLFKHYITEADQVCTELNFND